MKSGAFHSFRRQIRTDDDKNDFDDDHDEENDDDKERHAIADNLQTAVVWLI